MAEVFTIGSKSVMRNNDVSHFLKFWAGEGFLKRSDLNDDIRSQDSITEQGRLLVNEILKPLYLFAQDSNSIPEINAVRAELAKNPHAYSELYRAIGETYYKTSPYKNRDTDRKIADILYLIAQNNGKLTASDVAVKLEISSARAIDLIRSLIKSEDLQYILGKAGRKYLSITDKKEKRVEF